MMERGFLEEVKALVDRGYGRALIVQNSLGYRETILHLEGALTLEEATRLIKLRTRHFAKRQDTWFRHERNISWLDITSRYDYDAIASEITRITSPGGQS